MAASFPGKEKKGGESLGLKRYELKYLVVKLHGLCYLTLPNNYQNKNVNRRKNACI